MDNTNAKKKIVYIIPRFYPFKGGAEENTYALATRMVKEGYDVTVITTNVQYRNEDLKYVELHEGIKIIRNWALNKSLYAGFYPGLLPLLIKLDADIIHTSGIGFFWREFCLIIKKKISPNIKFITTPHGPFMALGDAKGFRGFARTWGNRLLKVYINWLYDKMIAVNSKQEAWMKELYGMSDGKIELITNGINESYIESEIVNHSEAEKVVITFMNRMEWYKGVQEVLKAIAKIKDLNFVFYIMGRAGGYTEKIKELITKFELENFTKIIFHPTDEERDRIFYEESQINILPSKYEAHGITLTEAMAKGNVILTTTGNEAADILIKEGDNGYVYNFNDIDALKNILKKLITNYDLRQKMRKRNLELSRNFTWESIVPKYVTLLDNLLPKKD